MTNRPIARAGLLLALAWLAAPAALAQPALDDGLFHDGRWAAKVEGSEDGYLSARVQIVEYAGTWQDTTPARHVKNKACAGKTFNITVQRSRTTDVEFMVWGSSVSPACPDLSVLLKPDGKALEGTIGGTAKVRLTRR
jgi:hypothetical protein